MTQNKKKSQTDLLIENLIGKKANKKKRKKGTKQKEVLTHKQLEMLIENADSFETQLIIITMVKTGMRVGELVNFKINWIIPGGLSIRIQSNKKPLAWEPKTQTSIRSIPIDEVLLKSLERHIGKRKKGYVFQSQKKRARDESNNIVRTFRKYNTRTINRRINDLSEKVFDKQIGTHIFRHTYASDLFREKGLDVNDMQKLLGHSSNKTTLLYLQSLPGFSSWDKVRQSRLMKLDLKLKDEDKK